ncbi:hypothetical protein V6N13_129756 [Hibiscus sabdariffa]|uniref:Uncharacterized protein n=1 Tax=Hibiscus sabdariffa TaxID=183260 RepID=A0ABR2SMG6_9ROSI
MLERRKNGNIVSQSQSALGPVGLLDTMRVQKEISEAMDNRTRQGLLNALFGKNGKRVNTLLIPLELLSCISCTEFSDNKTYIRWQKRWLKILTDGIANHPIIVFGKYGRTTTGFRILLEKLRNMRLFHLQEVKSKGILPSLLLRCQLEVT